MTPPHPPQSAQSAPPPPPSDRSGTPRTGSAAAIAARGLTRLFNGYAAVRDVSFSLHPGELVAFLGPNGAGKSTTMRLLTGFLAPSAGSAVVAGFDVHTHRREAAAKLGYLPENGPLYPDMTPLALLSFLGRARGLDPAALRARTELVIQQCKLGEVLGKAIGKLSKGYRQRVGMAAALLHDPAVLILDEPTAGLDPKQVDQMRGLLRDLAATRTILLSTHILSEVRAVADRILLIHRGRLVHDGSGASLGTGEREMEDRFRQLTRDAA